MNKTLTIIRHAKSDWPKLIRDFDRPLLERGISDAQLMGKHMQESNYKFDVLLCSGAKRARQTLDMLRTELIISDNIIKFDDEIYMSSMHFIMHLIENLPSSANWAAIIGHNPTHTQLCNYLADDDLSNLPTCAVYTISFQVDDWKAVGYCAGDCVSYITPKMLKG